MKNFKLTWFLVITQFFAQMAMAGYDTGPAYTVMRVGSAANSRPVFGAIDLSQGAATTNQLLLSKGGTGVNNTAAAGGLVYSSGTGVTVGAVGSSGQIPRSGGTSAPAWSTATYPATASTAGFALVSDGTNFNSSPISNAASIKNVGIKATVGSSALTIALTQADGSTNCGSGASACYVSMRNSTATTGGYVERAITGALSFTISSGTTLGFQANQVQNLWIYLVDSDGAGTMKLAASTMLYQESSLQTTTAESFATSCTQASPSICTSTGHTLHTNDAIRFTGTISGGLSTATTYLLTAVAANTFELTTSAGGTTAAVPINKTSGGTQTPTVQMADWALVSDANYSSKPIRLIGQLQIAEATPGTWASAPTSITMVSPGQLVNQPVWSFQNTTTQTIGTAFVALAPSTNVFDAINSYSTGGVFICPQAGYVHISYMIIGGAVSASAVNVGMNVRVAVNGTGKGALNGFVYQVSSVTLNPGAGGSADVNCAAYDSVEVDVNRDSNVTSFALNGTATNNWLVFSWHY